MLTGGIVTIAIIAVLFKYRDYVTNPWTRDGQVRAYVIQIAPRVSGPIIKLPIKDNQFIKADDLLFEIDPRTFKANLDQERANYDKTLDDIEALEKQVDATSATVDQGESSVTVAESRVKSASAQLVYAQITIDRARNLVEEGTISDQKFDDIRSQYDVAVANKEQADAAFLTAQSSLLQAKANLAQAKANLGLPGDANAQLRSAKAAVEEASLNLEFTHVEAPVDGYITNLNLRLGSQAVENQPALALVDVASYWVDAFFKETLVGKMGAGDKAIVTLMSYPDTPIEGRVDSIGWGIAQQDGSPGPDLLPNISPTFE